MKDSTRRMILFAVIVAAGLLLVFFDIPAVFLLTGIIALTIIVLFITGSIRVPKLQVPKISISLKKGAEQKGNVQKTTATIKPEKEKTGKKTGPSGPKVPSKKPSRTTSRFSSIRDAFSSMGKAISVISMDISRARKPKTAKKQESMKLDKMLDQSVQGRAPDIRSFKDATPEIIPAEKQNVSDAFSTLVNEPMNTELLDSVAPGEDIGDLSGLHDLELGSDMSGAFGDDISNLDIALDADDGITIDDDSDTDEVASILAANAGELEEEKGGETAQASSEMELGGLENLDIGAIDLDQELGDLENPDSKQSKPAAPQDKIPAVSASKPSSPAIKPAGGTGFAESPFASAPSSKMTASEKPREMGDSMLAFSSGKGMDDDLMSSLKSDASTVKKDNNAPLVRDLKDVKVPAADLEKELEGILSITKVKK